MAQQSLRQQCAERVGDADRRCNELRQGATQVIGVVGEGRGAQEVTPFAATMPANAGRNARAATLGGTKHKQLRPSPRQSTPRQRHGGRTRSECGPPAGGSILRIREPDRGRAPRNGVATDTPGGSGKNCTKSIPASLEECKPSIRSRPEEPAAYKLALESFPGGRPALSKSTYHRMQKGARPEEPLDTG
jgi:hypothetical protein